jgi:hypothetical protein
MPHVVVDPLLAFWANVALVKRCLAVALPPQLSIAVDSVLLPLMEPTIDWSVVHLLPAVFAIHKLLLLTGGLVNSVEQTAIQKRIRTLLLFKSASVGKSPCGLSGPLSGLRGSWT